jgi:hypothetical protein
VIRGALSVRLTVGVSGGAAHGEVGGYEAFAPAGGSGLEPAGADDVAGLEAAADDVVRAAQIDVYLIAAPDADVTGTVLPLIRGADGDVARNYDVSHTSVFVIRPQGYLAIVARGVVDTASWCAT